MQTLALCVQILALIGLFWYVIETMKMRKAAQQQVTASLELIKAATDQVEGTSKPCLTLWGELRNGADVMLGMHGAAGNIQARGGDRDSFVVQNIGNGIALSVSYHFERADPNRPPDKRYVPNLLATQKVELVETISGYAPVGGVTFEYGSIGGRRYRTIIQLNHRVITSFVFEEVR